MKSVVYLTCTKLPCIGILQAPVVLCVKDTVILESGKHFLPGFLLVSTEIYDDCDCFAYWRYTIAYDENLLTDPAILLTSDDITGVFCETCFTDWIQDSVNLCVTDSDSIDFDIDEGGCITGDVVLSGDVGNIIEIRADGLFAEAAGAVCVTDSLSIDFSIDGGGCVTGDVIISPGGEGANALVLLADGLFVNPPDLSDVWNTQSIGGGAVTLSVFSPLVLAACNAVASPTVLTIPSIANLVVVTKIDASANTVTIDPEFGTLINGSPTYVLTTQYQSVLLKRFGSVSYILAEYMPGKAIVTKTANYTATIADYTILVDASAAARTITLPTAATAISRIFNIKKIDASANSVTIDANGAETIDGATTLVTTTQWQSFQIQSNGTAWFTL